MRHLFLFYYAKKPHANAELFPNAKMKILLRFIQIVFYFKRITTGSKHL